jgi:tRNA(Ile)-lysidine synthase
MAPPRLAVAASGGPDSTALLHCSTRQAAALGIEVVALHVHHGLMPAADRWLAQVRAQSRRWGAGFLSRRLAGQPGAGMSVEAWARDERYRALAEMAQAAGCSLVLLAHHRRDQAETWLLQALRGAGPAGLSSMPQAAHRAGIVWARPWLDQPREAIDAYLRRYRLVHAHDESNEDPRYARNRLRLAVWPALVQAFPQAEAALVAAAARAQEAAALAAEVAVLDLGAVQQGPALHVPAWLALPPARRRNVLRAWFNAAADGGAPESLLDRLAHELPRVRAGRWPAPGAELRMYRGLLRAATGDAAQAAPAQALALDLTRPGVVALESWQGHFIVSAVEHGGAPTAMLCRLRAQCRTGGERFQLAAHGAARSLKKQFQARGVPAWEREGPLLYTAEGRLLFVPGLGIDARLLAEPGAPQRALRWVGGRAPDPGADPAAG